jgi:hypothetical protein
MIQYMGGTYRDEITSSTQILLAGKVGSVKYQVITLHSSSIFWIN